MNRNKFFSGFVLLTLILPTFVFGQPTSFNADSVAKIRDEGMNRSEAMKIMRYLSDTIGARLTNSPAQRRANQWTKEQFDKWGLKNATVDPWGEFGRGWELKNFSASVRTPEIFMPFRAYPKAWSPSTAGAITGDVVYIDAKDEAGLEKYKGKLKGAIVLMTDEREIKLFFDPVAKRQNEENLAKMEAAKPTPGGQGGQGGQFQMNEEQRRAMAFNFRKARFYFEEGAAVLVEPSQTDAGTIRVMGANLPPQQNQGGNRFSGMRVYSKDAPKTIPQIVAEAEQYNRVLRMVKQGLPVKMTVDLDAKFYDDDLQGYNTIAEIPGTDLKDEVVMIGAHLDSWHSASGSSDNGAGTTVVMEAMRILQTAGLKPRRTIRVGLWTGEEQGLLGSRGYVSKYLASTEETPSATPGQPPTIKIVKKPAHDKFAAYYNLDNGTGQIRGIYMQGNEALRPIFKSWLEPFKDIKASTVTVENTGGTDHLAFDMVGLPGFQFIQDPIEYFTRTWHTTQDVTDRMIEEDLKRSAVIMATFAYNSAMTDAKLPRKELAMTARASLLNNYDFRSVLDEIDFKNSGLNFSICGHPLGHEEIPTGFPSILATDSIHAHSAE